MKTMTTLAMILVLQACGSADDLAKAVKGSKGNNSTGATLASDTPADNDTTTTAPVVKAAVKAAVVAPTVLTEGQVTDVLDQTTWVSIDDQGECYSGLKYRAFFSQGTETLTTETYADNFCNGSPTSSQDQTLTYGLDGQGNIQFNVAAAGDFTVGAPSQTISDDGDYLSFSDYNVRFAHISFDVETEDDHSYKTLWGTMAEAQAAAQAEVVVLQASRGFVTMADMEITPVYKAPWDNN